MIRSSKSVTVPWIAWPGWRHVAEAIALGFLLTLWFELIYCSADFVTAHRTLRIPVHFQFELAIPFVPAMTVFYLSIFPLFWLSPFILRTRHELRSLFVTLSICVLCAGIVFLLVPAELAYEPADVPSTASG